MEAGKFGLQLTQFSREAGYATAQKMVAVKCIYDANHAHVTDPSEPDTRLICKVNTCQRVNCTVYSDFGFSIPYFSFFFFFVISSIVGRFGDTETIRCSDEITRVSRNFTIQGRLDLIPIPIK